MAARKRFKASGAGTLEDGCLLVPNGTYTLVEEQPTIEPFPDRKTLLAWIQKCVLGDLRTLRAGISVYLGDETRLGSAGLAGANFLLAAGCSTALEYFARIYKGNSNSVDNVRHYAKDFLGDRYAEVSGLLQRVLRNGLIHGSWPKTFCLASAQDARITVGIGVKPDDPHLEPIREWPGNSLGINAIRFLQDLDISVTKGFAPWLLAATDDAVLKRAAPGLLVVSDEDQMAREIERVVSWNTAQRSAG